MTFCMCYDVYYYLVKFQLTTPSMHRERKNYMVIQTKGHIMQGKIN